LLTVYVVLAIVSVEVELIKRNHSVNRSWNWWK